MATDTLNGRAHVPRAGRMESPLGASEFEGKRDQFMRQCTEDPRPVGDELLLGQGKSN